MPLQTSSAVGPRSSTIASVSSTLPSPASSNPPGPPESSSASTLRLRYHLAPSTLKHLLTIPLSPDRRQILELTCQAPEFRSFPIHSGEKGFFRDINENRPIPYLLRQAVSQPWHKVFLLVQIDLLKTGWPNKLSGSVRKELQKERGKMYNVLNQVLRCVVDILGERLDGRGVSVALDVLRSVKAGVWEGSNMDLAQVQDIGPGRMQKLGEAGVRNIRQLSTMEFYHIERVLSRNPPFGQNIRRHIKDFPYLQLKIDILPEPMKPPSAEAQEAQEAQGSKHWIARIWLGYDNKELPMWNKAHPLTTLVLEGNDGRLAWFWRGSVKRLQGGKEMTVRIEAEAKEKMKVTFACEEIVGTMIRETFDV